MSEVNTPAEDDASIGQRMRAAAAASGDVAVPELGTLQREAARRQRRGLAGRALAAVAAAAVLATAVLVWQPWSPDSEPPGPADDGAWFETFPVPTFPWDDVTGMEALVSGTLAFTDEGCTMLVRPDEPEDPPRVQLVIFPDATGLRYENGVRAVADSRGRVYAVEGQEFSYGGGWVTPNEEQAAEWAALCGIDTLRSTALINARPTLDPLTEPPPVPEVDLPTRLPTDEEQGYFEVPTFAWDPAEGGDSAGIEGTLRFEGNCPVLGEGGALNGLVFPNAEGHRNPASPDGPAAIHLTHPGGSSAAAYEGDHVVLAFAKAGATEWERLCGDVEVDSVLQIYQEFPN